MRIVIDYRPALRARTGVGEHIHQVTRELARNGDDEITLFSSSWKDRLPASLSAELPNVRMADRRIPVAALNLAWHRLRWPPVEAIAGGEYDIAHSPHPLLLPSRSAAQIVTIHDLYFLSHPERTSAEIRRDYPALVRSHADRADAIIVVSRFVAGEVQRRLGVTADRISVCMNGAPEWKTPPATLNSDGYLLYVGTLEPRKNVGGLLEAYGRLLARRTEGAASGGCGPCRTRRRRLGRRDEPTPARRTRGLSGVRLAAAARGAVQRRTSTRPALVRRGLRHSGPRSHGRGRACDRGQPRCATGSGR